MNNLYYALLVSLIPFFVVLITTSFAFKKPSKSFIALIQSIASGFILGSILVDLMPRLVVHGFQLSYVVSFIIGFLLMIWMQRGSSGCCSSVKSSKPLKAFLTPFAIEFLLTGVLIGIAAASSYTLLLLIAISFGICNLVCSMSISTRLSSSSLSVTERLPYALSMAILVPMGALISSTLIHIIPANWINDLIGFAIACLLSLVLFDLYPEAISENKSKGVTGIFCAISFVFLLYYFI